MGIYLKKTALARQVGKLLALLSLAMARAAGAGAGDQRVGLRDLLSASRGLVAEACDIIRSVQREREDVVTGLLLLCRRAVVLGLEVDHLALHRGVAAIRAGAAIARAIRNVPPRTPQAGR